MDAKLWELFQRIYASGITLIPASSDNIEVHDEWLPETIRASTTTNNAVLLSELRRQRIGERDTYPSPRPRRYAVPPTCRTPGACHRLGPRGPPETAQSCSASANGT